MALNQNQFTISTVKGTLAYDQGDVISVQFYSATATDIITPGEFVQIVAVPADIAPAVTCVAVGANKAAPYFGMVVTNPLKSAWAVGDKLEIVIQTGIAMVEVGEAVPAGSNLAYDPAIKQVVVAGVGDTVVGVALETATAVGQLIRAFIN